MITNATTLSDIKGPFKTVNLNAALGIKGGGAQFSWGYNDKGKLIWTFTYGGPYPIPTGVGIGAAVSYYNTKTWLW